jgi:hypothetical protein
MSKHIKVAVILAIAAVVIVPLEITSWQPGESAPVELMVRSP